MTISGNAGTAIIKVAAVSGGGDGDGDDGDSEGATAML